MAAFCDCTAASDYWLEPDLMPESFQYLSLFLAPASFCASAIAVFLSSLLSRLQESSLGADEATGHPDEQAPLVAPSIAVVPEPLLAAATDASTLSLPCFVRHCRHIGSVRDGTATQLHPHWRCLTCSQCCPQVCGSAVGGLPTVTACTRRGAIDFLGEHSPSGPLAADIFDGSLHRGLPSDSSKKEPFERDKSHVAHEPSKGSAFFPSRIKEGGLLSSFASLEGGSVAFRGSTARDALAEGLPRTKMNELCEWGCAIPPPVSNPHHQPSRAGEEKRGNDFSPNVSASASTTASLEHIPSVFGRTVDGEAESECWARCCEGSSPLLWEFFEDNNAAAPSPHAGKPATPANRNHVAAHGTHWAAGRGAHAFPILGPLAAGSRGFDTGWKPYFMMLGFQGSGGCKRECGRMKRIGDLKGLEVTIVDADEEPSIAFGGRGASRVCDA